MTEPSRVIVPVLLKYFHRGGNRVIRAIKEIGVAGLVLVPAAALTVILLSGGIRPQVPTSLDWLLPSHRSQGIDSLSRHLFRAPSHSRSLQRATQPATFPSSGWVRWSWTGPSYLRSARAELDQREYTARVR